MILGEVGEQSAGLFDQRQSKLLAQRHQRLVGLDLLAGALGEHDRVLRLGELGGELFDVFRRSQDARRGRNRTRIGCGGVQPSINVSVETDRYVGPVGCRCASSPARMTLS